PVFSDDTRQIAEAVVRGTYPIGLGVTQQVLQQFIDAGVANDVKLVDVDGATAIIDTSVSRFEGAPHPNAATVFLNWILSKDGQQAWTDHIQGGSRRLDVSQPDPTLVPLPGREYFRSGPESSIPQGAEVQKYLADLVKQ